MTTDGAIDFYCCPRFDSPSVFAALLDHGAGRVGLDVLGSRARAAGAELPSRRAWPPCVAAVVSATARRQVGFGLALGGVEYSPIGPTSCGACNG